MTYLFLLAAGLLFIWIGLKTKEEVLRIAAVVTSSIFLIWGFALTPLHLQLLIAGFIVVAVFPICMRCLNE